MDQEKERVHLIFPCCHQLLTKAAMGGAAPPAVCWNGMLLKLYHLLRVDKFLPVRADQMILLIQGWGSLPKGHTSSGWDPDPGPGAVT